MKARRTQVNCYRVKIANGWYECVIHEYLPNGSYVVQVEHKYLIRAWPWTLERIVR